MLHDLPATLQVTRWAYGQAEAAAAQVWVEARDVLAPLGAEWRSVLDNPAGMTASR